MIQRIVDCNVPPERLDDLRRTIDKNFLSRIKEQPGFIDVVESADETTGQFVCMTFWRTREDVDRYDAGLFQEIANELMLLVSGGPRVTTLEVETSTPHGIAARRAAA